MSPITNETEFLASLRGPQLRYYAERVADHDARLQTALRQLAMGMSTVSALHEETVRQVHATRVTR